MDKSKLKEIISELVRQNSSHEKRYESFGRVWTELRYDEDKFTEYVLNDIDQFRDVNRILFFSLMDSEKKKYDYPPRLLAAEIKSHILRVESLSNYFALMIGMLSIIVSLALSTWFKYVLLVFMVCILGLIKWNVDRHLVSKKQLVNHLDALPEQIGESDIEPGF